MTVVAEPPLVSRHREPWAVEKVLQSYPAELVRDVLLAAERHHIVGLPKSMGRLLVALRHREVREAELADALETLSLVSPSLRQQTWEAIDYCRRLPEKDRPVRFEDHLNEVFLDHDARHLAALLSRVEDFRDLGVDIAAGALLRVR